MVKKDALMAAVAVTLAAAPAAFAGENPFSSVQLSAGYMVAEKGKDMAGNDVEMPANFTYGGDNMATYAGGKMATGVKDPAVCGTYSEAKCSIKYTDK